jgi:isoamyl acetate esterase
VPLEKFRKNICDFVDRILVSGAPSLSETKIILITPPPVAIKTPPMPDSEEMAQDIKEIKKESVAYRTYLSKKLYAEEIMKIAAEYAEVTDRVAGLHLWKALVDAALREDGRDPEAKDAYDAERLPGCGLPGSTAFSEGYFRDGLHFDRKVS